MKKVLDRYKNAITDMTTLDTKRTKAMKYYNGEVSFKSEKGRSGQTTHDVYDIIEWTMPFLMRTFYGGSEMATLTPRGGEDEHHVRLMQGKVNWDMKIANDGFKLLYNFFKDALMNEMGVVKYGWQNSKEYVYKEYDDLNIDQLNLLQQSGSFEFTNVETIQTLVGNTYNVSGKRIKTKSRPLFENVPPEEFIFDKFMRSKNDIGGINIHRKLIYVEEAKRYGLSSKDIEKEIRNFSDNQVIQERFKDLGGLGFLTPDKDNDMIYVNEAYFYDIDEEGNPIPMKMSIIGDQERNTEFNKYGEAPFCILSPILTPHRMFGMSWINILMDNQDTRTSLLRAILDNIYFNNFGRKVVNPWRIDISDIGSRNIPGGMLFTKDNIDPSTAISDVTPSLLPREVFSMFSEILPELRTDSTGITKHDQELPGKTAYKTSGGIAQIMGAMQQRKELLARVFAETGVKDLIRAAVNMNQSFFNKAENIRIDQEWVVVGPDDIEGEYDIEIDVGMATGSGDIEFEKKSRMLNNYQGIAKALGPYIQEVVTLDNLRELMAEMWKDLKYKNPGRFVNMKGATNIGIGQRQAQGGAIPPQSPINPRIFQGNEGQVMDGMGIPSMYR